MIEAMCFSCVRLSKTPALRRRRMAQTMAQKFGSLKRTDDLVPKTRAF
jgi:hypothetical protein